MEEEIQIMPTTGIMDALTLNAKLTDPHTPLELVEAWFASKNIRVNALKDLSSKGRRDNLEKYLIQLHNDVIEHRINKSTLLQAEEEQLARDQYRKPKPVSYRGFTRQEIDTAVLAFLQRGADVAFEEVRAGLAYRAPNGSDDFDKLVKLISKNPSDLEVAVLKHMIWQVKRKMNGHHIKWELFLNFMGPQGVGKTTFLRKFMEPLQELYIERTLKEIANDGRTLYLLQSVYAIGFEELEQANKVDIDSLKSLMSKDKISWRILGKNADANGFQNTTFFSTSNNSLAYSFHDTTGMRRFYEMTVKSELDHNELSKIDYLKLWHAVDESKSAAPIEPYLTELFAFQEEALRQKSTIETFVEEENLEPGSEEEAKALKDVYLKYHRHCNESNVQPFSKYKFSKKLEELGFVRIRRGGQTLFCIKGAEGLRASGLINFPSVQGESV